MKVDRTLVVASIATLGKLVFVWRADVAMVWITLEVGTRLATLGFDRGLVRANRAALIAIAVAVAGGAGWAIGWVVATPMTFGYAIASVLLATARPLLRSTVWGLIEPIAFVGGFALGAPWLAAVILVAIAVSAMRIERAVLAKREFVMSSLALGIADAIDVIASRADELLMVGLYGAHEFTVEYIVVRELVTLGRGPIEYALADRTALARVRQLAVIPAIAICVTELAIAPLHVVTAIIVAGRFADIVTSPSTIALALTARPSFSIVASAAQLVVIAGGALSGPLGLAIAASVAPLVRNIVARHFLESP